jgi:hypothetical protein
MKQSIEVVFDGKSFVPTEPIDLPTGTKLTLAVPETTAGNNPVPLVSELRVMTDEEKARWERLCHLWETTPPPFPTVEEAMAYSRGRPWPELLLAPDPVNAPSSNEIRKDGSS